MVGMEVNFCVFGGQGKTTGYDKWFQFLYFFKILNILFNLTEKDDCANLLNPRRTASHGGLHHHQHHKPPPAPVTHRSRRASKLKCYYI